MIGGPRGDRRNSATGLEVGQRPDAAAFLHDDDAVDVRAEERVVDRRIVVGRGMNGQGLRPGFRSARRYEKTLYSYLPMCADVLPDGAGGVNPRSHPLPRMTIEVRDLRVVYDNGVEALRGANLVVRRGEIVALIGRSGAGKSTLLRCLNGLQAITAGTVLIDGKDVSRMTSVELRALRRQIGFVWQEFNVVKRLNVFKNVLTGRLGHRPGLRSLLHLFDRHDREIAFRSLERVNLQGHALQRADRLSGGEKQRVAIARALAQQPRLILADEPVASLDAELAWVVMKDLVAAARDEGVPTLISLHDVPLARTFADRIIGIAGGVTVFDGPPSRLDDKTLTRIYRIEGPPGGLTAPLPEHLHTGVRG
jgi:phosphonate transport system ATP-binding protein